MNKMLISLVTAAALVSSAGAESLGSGVDSSGNSSFDQVDNDTRNLVRDSDLEGATADNSVVNIGAKADSGSAAANNGSYAETDNRVFLKDSALSRTALSGHVTGNAVHMEDSKFVSVNKIENGAFKEARGVSQVSQNSGQNSLIQQSFTIQSNLKVDHTSSP
jgi:hypothetical protein